MSGLMEEFTLGSGQMDACAVGVNIHGQMGVPTRGNI
jgi:hypothetical protein